MGFLNVLWCQVKKLCLGWIFSLLFCNTAHAVALNQVQAALTYSLLNFVHWQNSAFASDNAPIVICLFSDNEFKNILELTTKNEKVGGRAIRVTQLERVQTAPECHLLYVDAAQQDKLAAVKLETHYPNALTVGNSENFAKNIGMVEFKQTEAKLKVLVNLKRAEKSQIKILSNLLNIAEIVE